MGKSPIERAVCVLQCSALRYHLLGHQQGQSTAGTSNEALSEEHPLGQGSLKETRGKKQAKPWEVLGFVFEYLLFL